MNGHPAAYWREIASGRRRDPSALLLVALLAPAALVYALLQLVRAMLYRTGVLTARRLPRPVISVGNITVGGTGKTPVTAHIARLLMQQGARVAVLSRGYGGSMEGRCAVVADGRSILLDAAACGDEPYLLASQLPGLIVVIGSNRYHAGCLAMEAFNPDVFLLDDGFQHLRLQRDLNILLLDARHPFGNRLTLPAGLLREPLSAAFRADLVIHTRCPAAGVLHPLPGRTNLAARHQLSQLVALADGTDSPFSTLAGKRVVAFAAIAEPASFFTGLQEQGMTLVQTLAFPDHAPYADADLERIGTACRDHGADALVTTAKDSVKLKSLPAELASRTFVACLELGLDDGAPLSRAVMNLLQK